MGDRGNIVIDYGKKRRIYFYTHWNGSSIKEILKGALLRGKERWDDPSYLARIIFCELIGEDQEGVTGYGISPYLTDNEHPLLIVDVRNKLVWLEDKEGNYIGKKISFSDFVKEEIK